MSVINIIFDMISGLTFSAVSAEISGAAGGLILQASPSPFVLLEGIGFIVGLIFSLVFIAVPAAFFSIFSAVVLKLTTRLAAKTKLPYLPAYRLSFCAWYISFIFWGLSSLLAFLLHEKPIAGEIPNSLYLAATLAVLVISILYGIKIERPDERPIGIGMGFLLSLLNAGIFIFFVMAVFGYMAAIGP